MGATVRGSWILLRRELAQLVRDPIAILTILVAPIVIAVIASVSLGAERSFDVTIAVSGADEESMATAIDSAKGRADIDIIVIPPQTAEEVIRRGDADAAVVVTETADGPRAIVLGAVGAEMATRVAASVARTAVAQPSTGAVAVDRVAPGRAPLAGSEIYGPVIAVFIVLFGVGFVARSLHSERRQGTLTRLLASPISPTAVLISKGALMFVVGVVEFLAIIFTTTIWFGADWGDPLSVALVTVLVVLLSIAIATAIAGFSRSSAQALALEAAVALTLVGVGGHMVPMRNLPDIAAIVARYTPNGAAIDAFAEVSIGSSLGVIAGRLLIVVAFTLVIGIAGAVRIRKVLVS